MRYHAPTDRVNYSIDVSRKKRAKKKIHEPQLQPNFRTTVREESSSTRGLLEP